MGNVVFAGTASFAVPTLRGLVAAGHVITGVITQPDKPGGRGQRLQASPVKQAAAEFGLSVHQPTTFQGEGSRALFQSLQPELMVVVAYGRILPPWLVALPPLGVVNLHGSLLPQYRGAAPVQWAVANGEAETGVCTMKIDEGLDTGPVYLCQKTSIDPDEPVHQLSDRLAGMGSGLVERTLAGILAGTLTPSPQDHNRATYAPILKKEDGYIDWRLPARTIHNRIRAFQPWPGAVTRFRDAPFKILRSKVIGTPGDTQSSAEAGTIVPARSDRSGKQTLAAVCGDAVLLELLEVQLPSRKSWTGTDFLNSMRVVACERFQPIADN